VKLTVAVLAGGRSCRMGRDKAKVATGGRSLLERQLAVLEAVRPGERIVSCREDQHLAVPSGVRLVFDDGAAGPLGGVAAILRAASAPAVLVLAVDLGCIEASLLRKLAARAAVDGSVGVAPRSAGGIEPLVAVYPRALLELVEERLHDARDLSMHSLTRAAASAGLLRWYDVPVFEEPQFANWNRPIDVRRIR
jgi:molybdopterin-guanine dinucleotide biosynthesis protein A